jgi:Tic22-like family
MVSRTATFFFCSYVYVLTVGQRVMALSSIQRLEQKTSQIIRSESSSLPTTTTITTTTTRKTLALMMMKSSSSLSDINDDFPPPPPPSSSSSSHANSRRQSIATIVSTVTGLYSANMLASISPFSSSLSMATVAAAAAAEAPTTTAATTAKDVLSRLVSIPAFCLVDPDGVPFMIFDGQASATGYFFLSYQVAAQALEDARQKDIKTQEAQDLWRDAQIVVVPLSVAIQLAVSKRQRIGVNTKNKGNVEGIKFNTYNDVVASAEGISDAKIVPNSGNPDRWSQKGRVPLFYIDGLTITDPKGGPTPKQPRYFNKADLLAEWKKQQQQQNGSGLTVSPTIQVIEMIELFRNAIGRNDWTALADVVIMPVEETNQVAREIMKQTSNIKYSFEKVFLVNAAKS